MSLLFESSKSASRTNIDASFLALLTLSRAERDALKTIESATFRSSASANALDAAAGCAPTLGRESGVCSGFALAVDRREDPRESAEPLAEVSCFAALRLVRCFRGGVAGELPEGRARDESRRPVGVAAQMNARGRSDGAGRGRRWTRRRFEDNDEGRPKDSPRRFRTTADAIFAAAKEQPRARAGAAARQAQLRRTDPDRGSRSRAHSRRAS
jgi:hypothetical protein